MYVCMYVGTIISSQTQILLAENLLYLLVLPTRGVVFQSFTTDMGTRKYYYLIADLFEQFRSPAK
jgi:hypothetical protein